jgi:hypothetical protein
MSMNAYTTRTRARIQPQDMARALLTDPSTAAISLATLERIRAYQAEAEVASLLQQHGIQPESVSSRVAMVRQMLGAVLVRTRERLGGVSGRDVSLETTPVAGTLRTAG